MTNTTLGRVPDGKTFKLSNRKSGVTYKVIRKTKYDVTYTSLSSERSGVKKKGTIVYV